jgi:hypothetical protein
MNIIVRDLSADLIKEAILKARREKLEEYNDIRNKSVEFYRGLQYSSEYLEKYGFNYSKVPPLAINLTKKIVDKISLCYKWAPDRYLDDEKDTDQYRDFLADTPQFNESLKDAERYKNLLGNILFRIWYDDKRKIWRFFIEHDFDPWFLEDDPLNPIAYSILVKPNVRNVKNKDKVEDMLWMFWSDEEYFYYDADGKRIADKNHPDMKNPFGMMPIVEMRDSLAVDEYDCYGCLDVVNANQSINVDLMSLSYMVHWQAHSKPYIMGADPDKVKDIKTGSDEWLVISDRDVTVGNLSLTPLMQETIETIKFKIQQIAWSHNLSINWTVEGSAPSGFSLIVQNIDLLEAREDDIEIAQMQEKQIYKVLARLSNRLGTPIKLPENMIPSVQFQDYKFPINQAEELNRLDWEIEHNVISYVDLIQNKYPDMDEAEAIELFNKNKRINGKMSFRDVLAQKIGEQGGEVKPEDTVATE